MVLLVLAVVIFAAAAPIPPQTLNQTSSSRRPAKAASSVQAQAGNVTELFINTSTITQGWQGYYGNITGTIVLDDADNNSMYTWDLADPEGEVYVTRDSDSIDWGTDNIICANISHVEDEESTLNFNLGTGQDVDGINETFSHDTHPAFKASNNSFNADECDFTVSTYVDDAPGVRSFNETLLYSKSDDSLIYAAMIVQGGADGFKMGTVKYDFQMLVAEDGHSGDTSVTNYYFYVEIE